MEKLKIRKSAVGALLWMILIVAALTGATYAWFTFSASTNVEPMGSTVSDEYTTLLISNSENGPFEESVNLSLTGNAEILNPVSTSKLDNFYKSIMQNKEGITLLYKDSTNEIDDDIVYGTLYLKSTKGRCRVYFNMDKMNFGSDIQMLASMRLGLRITSVAGEKVYIFDLSEFGNTAGAASVVTVPNPGMVVNAIDNDGNADYVADPSESISDYTDGTPLCTLKPDEVAKVDYYLYLEGCDNNCSNPVRSRETALALSFVGRLDKGGA